MSQKAFIQASAEGIRQEMERDPSIFIAGEDVGVEGVFSAFAGAPEAFGPERVVDTPISESGIMGLAVGAAAAGLRPVVDLMFMDFIGVCYDQIINQMAKNKYMFGGKAKLPIVVETASGGGMGMAAQHSQSLEAIVCHIPGLKVVMASTPYDVKGLLISSIRDDNPVIFIHNKRCMRVRGEVPDELYEVPLGVADVKREGTDVTVVATGYQVHDALEAATELEGRGVSVEVVDPRTLSPLDTDTIIASVEKTGRAVVAQEAVNFCSLGAEIAAQIQERAFDSLDAPVMRVGAPFSPVPFSKPLEEAWMPGKDDIVQAIEKIVPVHA